MFVLNLLNVGSGTRSINYSAGVPVSYCVGLGALKQSSVVLNSIFRSALVL